MAITPEGRVKAKVKALLDKYNIYYFMPTTGGYGRSGIPDIIACLRGRFLAIECKAGSNKPTALQERELDRIEESGGIAYVINDIGDPNLESFEGALRAFIVDLTSYPLKKDTDARR
jgi:hypothetical protein